jgi:hypothetical protein
MESLPLILAGSLALVGAGLHGIGGELAVVRRLSPAALPASRFGGPATTLLMIRATWHLTTAGFLTVAFGLLLSGSVLEGDTARGIGLLAAAGATAFAAVTLALGAAASRSPRGLIRHPAPALLTVAVALAWWGVL